MKMSDVEVPSGKTELQEFVKTQDDKKLALILKKELKGEKRRYVVTRIAQRINNIRGNRFMEEVMGKLNS